MTVGKRAAVVERWNAAAASYEDTIEKRTAFFVGGLVDCLQERDRELVVDVACGTGIVTLALAGQGVPVFATDHSAAMVARTRERVEDRGLGDLVETGVADAMDLDLPDDHASAAVSNHGVIFCPDVGRAIAEMARVTRPGGLVALTAWTPTGRHGLQYLLEIDAETLGFEAGRPEGFAFSDRAALDASLDGAALVDQRVDVVDGPSVRLPSWEAIRGMLEAPAFAVMFDGLDAAQSARLEEVILARTREVHGEGPIEIPRQAWIASGRVAGA